MVNGWATGVSPNLIEENLLSHFLPETRTLSFGTLGCNMACSFCNSWKRSQQIKKSKKKKKLIKKLSFSIKPEQIANLAMKMKCKSVCYTYNEPTVFVEYALATMKKVRELGLKNVWISNGYFSDECRQKILPYLDAINIDLKSGRAQFYNKICKAKISPVKDNIKELVKAGVHVEITTLVIPGKNDSKEELKKIADFLVGVDKKIPWHLTSFQPSFEMEDVECTPKKTLLTAKEIGKKAGLKRVYVGNK